jgi:hypothetical protein
MKLNEHLPIVEAGNYGRLNNPASPVPVIFPQPLPSPQKNLGQCNKRKRKKICSVSFASHENKEGKNRAGGFNKFAEIEYPGQA